jgi:hypothetical protein
MKNQVMRDPVPVVYSGPRTYRCNDCGWETVWVLPEECDSMLDSILSHIQQHGIVLPQIEVTIY